MLTPIKNFTVNNVLTDKQMCDSSKSIMPGKLHMKHASQTHLNACGGEEGAEKNSTQREVCSNQSDTHLSVNRRC